MQAISSRILRVEKRNFFTINISTKIWGTQLEFKSLTNVEVLAKKKTLFDFFHVQASSQKLQIVETPTFLHNVSKYISIVQC